MAFRFLIFGLFISNGFTIRVERIVGGMTTKIEQAPYMLSLRANGKHICGAVLIGKEWGLTAAHCCIEGRRGSSPPLKLSVRGSSSRLSGPCGIEHQVVQAIRHPSYRGDNDDWDLCALRLEPPVKYSNRFAPVGLPQPQDNVVDQYQPSHIPNEIPVDDDNVPYSILGGDDGVIPESGVVSGWGYTQAEGRVPSPILKSLNVTKVDLQFCKDIYRHKYIVHDRDVCFGTGTKSSDTCMGDSGGPLVSDDFILIGIVSFGDECGYSVLPGVYTDVLQFRGWIQSTTGL